MGPTRLSFFSDLPEMENCTFSFILVVYLLVTISVSKSHKIVQMSAMQKEIYETIKQERLMLFTIGLISGALVSKYIVYLLKIPYPKCTIFALAYMWSVLFYSVAPKSTYMMYHLAPDQQKQWMLVYQQMKVLNALFFTLAVVSLILRV